MIMEIHSKFGVLYCTPLTLQDIKKSIPEGQDGANKDTQATADDQDSVSPESVGNI